MAESRTETRKHHRHAWLLAAAAVTTAQWSAPNLIQARWHPPCVEALSFYLGVVGGLFWQRLNRADFVDRFLGFALLSLAITQLALLPSSSVELNRADGSWSFPGVVVGVVLAEGWMRQRHRP